MSISDITSEDCELTKQEFQCRILSVDELQESSSLSTNLKLSCRRRLGILRGGRILVGERVIISGDEVMAFSDAL